MSDHPADTLVDSPDGVEVVPLVASDAGQYHLGISFILVELITIQLFLLDEGVSDVGVGYAHKYNPSAQLV